MNQLQVIELSKVYPGGVQALAGVSFTLEKGEFLSVIGPSGSGKTTLFRILNGTEQAASGQVLYDKSQHFEQARGRKKWAMQVEQASCLDNVLNAALPDMGSLPGALGLFRPQQREEAAALLARVGLADKRTVRVNQLSGGQKQRVACARAVVTRPSLILADEPTGALDSRNSRMLLECLGEMNSALSSTILMVTHDAFSASYASRVIFIKDGSVFHEIFRGDDVRRAFFSRIIDVVTLLGGDVSDVI